MKLVLNRFLFKNPLFVEKKQFDETSDNKTILSLEETFRIQYFVYRSCHCSLDKRFEQYKLYEIIFGFLFDSFKLKMNDDESLKSCCNFLENSLKIEDLIDIDGDELFLELKFLK